jgi:hypothetical protein
MKEFTAVLKTIRDVAKLNGSGSAGIAAVILTISYGFMRVVRQ